MSHPLRYDVGMTEEVHPNGSGNKWPWVYPSAEGKYVLHSDYALLSKAHEEAAQSAFAWKELYGMLAKRWQVAAEHQEDYASLAKHYADLQAENERLRKALIFRLKP